MNDAPPADYSWATALLSRLNVRRHGEPALPLPLVHHKSAYANGEACGLQFVVRLADQPLKLRPRVVQLRTPAGSGHYPVSYSVVYAGRLVALFKRGNFACYQLPDFRHDEALEQQLNTRRWQRHWLIGGQLVALHGGLYYAFGPAPGTDWQPYQQPMPFGSRPKLFEDARYLAYANCQGEFGGHLYFFNKQTQRTHRVEATCATSLWATNGQYQVLASLDHMWGSAQSGIIADPEMLPLASDPVQPGISWEYDLPELVPNEAVTRVFDYYGLQLFGSFQWQGQTVYLTHWQDATFLSTIAHDVISIVDPLFADGFCAHEPVTTAYGPDLVVTNLGSLSLGSSREVATLVFQKQQVFKIEWGKQY